MQGHTFGRVQESTSRFEVFKHEYDFALSILLIISAPFTVHMAWILFLKIWRDYRAFLALGPGGTSPTVPGYLRICLLRLGALKNPFLPPSSQELPLSNARLNSLSSRSGARPKVAGIAPQRQLDQKASVEAHAALCLKIETLGQQCPGDFFTGRSCFEDQSMALFSKTAAEGRVICNGEICRTHSSDGSLHLTLHPADIKIVLEKGWGQRHPLARDPDSWWRWHKVVPTGFVLVYAPRDQAEVEVVSEIIRAAAGWVQDSDFMDIRANQTCTGADMENGNPPEETPEHGWKHL